MKHKYLRLVALTCLVGLAVGALVYRNYNSIENSSKRLARNNITDWIYSAKSLTHDRPGVLKSEGDRNRSIELRKAVDNLDTEWRFESENWHLLEAGYDGFLIDYTYIFANEKSDQLKIFSNRYYYDLDEICPVPLKREVVLNDNDRYETLETDKLWEGDFDALCTKAD